MKAIAMRSTCFSKYARNRFVRVPNLSLQHILNMRRLTSFTVFCLLVCVSLQGCGDSKGRKTTSDRQAANEQTTKNTKQKESVDDSVTFDLPRTQSGSLGGSLVEQSAKNHPSSPTAKRSRCSGHKIGIYSWDQNAWKSNDSALVKHLHGKNARSTTCGDIMVNVADYSNPHKIYDSERLVPFIKSVRAAGNEAVVYLTYGDVETKNSTACRQFMDTFFSWVKSVPISDRKDMKQIGASFDIEHFPIGHTEQLLRYAQDRKNQMGLNDVLIQWTIEGRVNPVDTDAVMKYADSALMMAYRNYMSKPEDLDGSKNGLLKRMQYMLKEQCSKCLDDQYASKHYKAKITIMIETACNVAEYCDRVSFCASDKGVAYVVDTLNKLRDGMLSSGLITAKQNERLFQPSNMFAIHHWEWFQCYYEDPLDTSKLCGKYRQSVKSCKGK